MGDRGWGESFCIRVAFEISVANGRACFSPLSLAAPSGASAGAQARHAVVALLGKGLAPTHRTAVLNAKAL
jgi:hypothetical protein